MFTSVESRVRPNKILHQVTPPVGDVVETDGFRIIRAPCLVYESPEDRYTRKWEDAQEGADQLLANNPTYQRLYRRYLALVKNLQGGGLTHLTKQDIGEMNLLGGQMGIFERLAAFHAPILTGEYPRDRYLPPTEAEIKAVVRQPYGETRTK